MSYTTTDLLSSIKSRGQIPTSQNTFSTSDLLRIADEITSTRVLPMVMPLREEFYAFDHDYTITASQASYRIPRRAIGMKLRDVKRVDSAGNETSLARLEPEDSNINLKSGFYLKGNSVVIYPTPVSTEGILRLTYFIRPSSLVATTAAAQVQSIDTGLNQIVVTTLPSTITTSTLVDIVKSDPGFECLAIDQTITGISGTTLSFSSLPDDLAVGDWIALAGQTPIPQLPVELHPILAQAVAVQVLESLGFADKAEAADKMLTKMIDNCEHLLSPRVDGEPKKVINLNSLLRSV